MPKTLLRKAEKGHLGQYEDWWYLVENEDGTRHIEHSWDHVSVRGFDRHDGSEEISVETFLQTGHHEAVAKLKKILERD